MALWECSCWKPLQGDTEVPTFGPPDMVVTFAVGIELGLACQAVLYSNESGLAAQGLQVCCCGARVSHACSFVPQPLVSARQELLLDRQGFHKHLQGMPGVNVTCRDLDGEIKQAAKPTDDRFTSVNIRNLPEW